VCGRAKGGIGHYERKFYHDAAHALPSWALQPSADEAHRGSGGRSETAAPWRKRPIALIGCIGLVIALFMSCATRTPPPLLPPGTRVIGPGFGRTGTNSLKVSLDRLGLKTYHAQEVTFSQMQLWAAVQRARVNGSAAEVEAAERAAVDAVISSGYTAVTDWPASNVYRRFLERWPDARVVLTTRRNSTAWADSFAATLGRALPVLRSFPFSLVPDAALSTQFCFEGAGIALDADGRLVSAQQAAAALEARTAQVRKWIMPVRLLLVEASTATWKPLCDFLGVKLSDCPVEEPYPHSRLTRRSTFQAIMSALELVTTGGWR